MPPLSSCSRTRLPPNLAEERPERVQNRPRRFYRLPRGLEGVHYVAYASANRIRSINRDAAARIGRDPHGMY